MGFKVGVAGCGYWGPNLIRNFLQNPDVSEVVCCDLSEARLAQMRQQFHGIRTFTDYDQMLSHVDAVAIATPVALHYALAKKAIEAKKHVLVEKPLTKTSAEAKELTKLADQMGVALMVDHTFEYSVSVRKIKELLDKKELGEVFNINMTRVNLGIFQKDVNVVWDLAPHDISLLRFILGKEPISVQAFAESHVMPGIVDTAYLLLRFDGKITAHIHLSWLSPRKQREMTIIGSKKMLVYDDVSPGEKVKIYDKGVSVENKLPSHKYYESFGEFQLLYRSGDIYIPNLDEREPLKDVCSHFINCIKSGAKPLSDGNSGYNVLLALEAAQKSMDKKGEEISLS